MRLLAVPFLALALTVLLVAPAVLADDDEDWGDGERHVDTDVRSDGFDMVSDRAEGAQRDRIRLSLEGSNVEFRFELLASSSSTEAEASLRIRLERVIEFEDRNGDGAFQASDEVREGYRPHDLSLTDVSSADVTSNGVPGVQVTASYSFRDAPNATLGFRATAFGNVATFEDVGLKPVETKIDLLFGAFPYSESDTLPGVELHIRSDKPRGPATVANGLTFRAGNLNATFGWKQAATVDGVDRPVRLTLTENDIGANETEADIAFAYARGSTIVHDSTFGFSQSPVVQIPTTPTTVLGNPVFYTVGVLAAVAVFGSFAFARMGRKAKGT